jgi:hypothetical protein
MLFCSKVASIYYNVITLCYRTLALKELCFISKKSWATREVVLDVLSSFLFLYAHGFDY